MQSPFEIFRKHQKMLTVILTGLAMFAFVILGAVPDPSNMPPALTAIFLAGVLGGMAWIAGIRSKKSSEWGTIGVIAGLVLGVAASVAVGPPDVVRADTGNITTEELGNLRYQRELANRFVGMAYRKAEDNGAQFFQPPRPFGFGHPDQTKDIVVGELLRREADRLGMQATDQTVNDFIRSLTQGKVGRRDVTEIRTALGVSETGLYESLAAELKALNMARLLYSGNTLPPVEYWDFYEKMNVQVSAGIAPIAVEAFIDSSAEPTDAELKELFDQHKGNFPNTTPEGRLEEGLVGFRQPRRVALEYIEIPYEAVEKTIPEITDEEIEQYYAENYKSAPDLEMPAEGTDPPADGPLLPEVTPEEDGADDANPDEPPADGDAQPDKTGGETDGAPETPPADAGSDTGDDAKPAEDAKPDGETATDEAADAPADSSSQEPADDDAADGAGDDESGAAVTRRSPVQLVAFYDDEQPAESDATQSDSAQDTSDDGKQASSEQPETDSPATEEADKPTDADQKPAADSPPEDAPSTAKTPAEQPETDAPAQQPESSEPGEPANDKTEPANDKTEPAEDKDGSPAEEAPAEDDAEMQEEAPADPNQPRELDDELRSEIRDQILRRKTSERQQELMSEVYDKMVELSFDIELPPIAEGGEAQTGVTPESKAAITEQLREFAKAEELVYEQTPLLSQRELSRSEEYPVGRAVSATDPRSTASVAQVAFNAAPTDLYRAEQAIDIETGSRFVFWKTEDVASYIPESLDSPGIREQVVQTWRELQARKRAEERAEELAKQANGIDKPLGEILAGETVTGKEGGQAITVVHPPKFSWLSAPNAQMSPNPFNRPAPILTELRTVPGDVGGEFMEEVFDDLQPGEAGVAHSFDMQYYYVVQVDERSYGTSPNREVFRERFTMQPVFDQFGLSDYSKLASRELQQYQTNWAEELFKRHHVVFSEQLEDSESES